MIEPLLLNNTGLAIEQALREIAARIGSVSVNPEDISRAVSEYLSQNPVEGVTPEAIAQAVADYLTENPVGGVDEGLLREIVTGYLQENPVGGTSNYNDLDNRPSINGVPLIGNKTSEELGLTAGGVPEIEIPQEIQSLKAINSSGVLISATTTTNRVLIADVSEIAGSYVLVSGVSFSSSGGTTYRFWSIQNSSGAVLEKAVSTTSRVVYTDRRVYLPPNAKTLLVQGSASASDGSEYPKVKLDAYYNNAHRDLEGRTVVVLGDSTCDKDSYNIWVRLLIEERVALGCDVVCKATASSGWNTYLLQGNGNTRNVQAQWDLAKLEFTASDPIVIIATGGNELDRLQKTYDEVLALCEGDTTGLSDSSQHMVQTLKNIIADKPKSQIYLISNPNAKYEAGRVKKRAIYRTALEAMCDYFGCSLIDLTKNSQVRGYLEVDGSRVYSSESTNHITTESGRKLIYKKIMSEVVLREKNII